ncbi:hypothetical protein LGT39_05680 [Demequina sp. TTPB684]|uniref:hypothetical protein n=1 Tax=unclassified Demequina TaxID=2620311 RepID=UPI001CF4DB7D|nr:MULTISPECIES: hypothetical protein [unclassified Demequina]MCB2412337.1 hypothetical protein [Demequina sp. TTPB684]UPU88510.1 hypothetical protein LGT36_000870 [Demequina sp. TMPB413]
MAMRDWSERRRRVWRWGWAALIVGVLFAPLGQQGSCADAASSVTGDNQCTTSYAPLLGLILPISYPAP